VLPVVISCFLLPGRSQVKDVCTRRIGGFGTSGFVVVVSVRAVATPLFTGLWIGTLTFDPTAPAYLRLFLTTHELWPCHSPCIVKRLGMGLG
jgi:hypothetical protein